MHTSVFTCCSQGKQVEVDSDFVIGCDGAYSVTRQAFMKRTDFNFSQEYIPHSYKELCIPKGKDGEVGNQVSTRGIQA